MDRTPAQAGEADPGAELRERVWRELEPHLGRPEVVLVSPDGPLNFLPLAALPGQKPGTFLVQEYAFAVAPAPVLLPDLLARTPGRPEGPSLLLVGGVDFGKAADTRAPAGRLPAIPTDWSELSGTEREVNDLQIQFQEAFPRDPPRLSSRRTRRPRRRSSGPPRATRTSTWPPTGSSPTRPRRRSSTSAAG